MITLDEACEEVLLTKCAPEKQVQETETSTAAIVWHLSSIGE